MQGLADAVVVFDLDGTFVDTAADLAAAMNFALSAAGRAPVAPSRVRGLVGHGARAMLRRGFAETGALPDEAALDAHVRVFLDYYLAHIADASRPFLHAVAAAEALREAGARLAVCTNKREAPSRLLLDALGLSTLFSGIVGMDTTAAAKPDPRPVLRCLELAGRTRAVMVGDSDTDIAAARAAGLPCLVTTLGYGPILEIGGAAGVFGDFRRLPALVARALGAIPPRGSGAASR